MQAVTTDQERADSGALPRRVLHVLNSPGGGAALSTIDIMRTVAQAGVESSAVCLDTGSASERQQLAEAVGGRVLFTPLYWSPKKTRARWWKRPILEAMQLWQTGWRRGSTRAVTQFARQNQVELIHTNTVYTPEGALAAARLRLPHVWHVRELIGPGQFVRLPWEGAALGRYLEHHSSKVIANSQATARLLQPWLPADLLDIVPNGIDVERFEARPNVERRPLVVAMVANLTSRVKKHQLFAAAAAAVPRDLPVEFRIYGHDPSAGGTRRSDAYVDALHARIAELGIGDRFRWPGFRSDPAQIMSEIDILVHPADVESFGRVLVEAMAAGLPVVSVQGGGPVEIVADGTTGILVPPEDARAIGEAVTRLATDSELRRAMGAAGRQRARAHFSLAACAAGVCRAYRAAMQRPLGTPPSANATRLR